MCGSYASAFSSIVAFSTRQPSIDAVLAGPMSGAFFERLIIQ